MKEIKDIMGLKKSYKYAMPRFIAGSMPEYMIKFDEKDEGVLVENFTEPEAEELGNYVTNTDSNVFVIKTNSLTQEQSGALLSRYSRTALNGRRLLLKEFIPNKDRGREFFESWLVDYGDDSIQEMAGGIPLSCEFVSNVAAKEIEDSRFGSYIEKSSRYVSFDKKLPNGEYMFYKDPDIMQSRHNDEYLSLMRGLFDSYTKYIEPMVKEIKEANPFESQTFRVGEVTITPTALTKNIEEEQNITEQDLKKSYGNAIKANALDFMRDYLPMATLTHVGISCNARSYENIILKLGASPLSECTWTGKRMHEELSKIVPSLLKRIPEKHGKSQLSFLKDKNLKSIEEVKAILSERKGGIDKNNVLLTDYTGINSKDPDAQAQTLLSAAIIYKYGEGNSFSQSLEISGAMDQSARSKLISNYSGKRENRRQRLGRAFENIDYLFDFCGRVGIYRDLQRHRIGTQERQRFSVKLGYNTRDEYARIGIKDDYEGKMAEVESLFNKLSERMPFQAQYVVTYGFNARWYYRMNARQFAHMVELRTTPAGHPDYRQLMQQAYYKINEVHPSIAKHFDFVDLSESKLGRLNSEIRIAIKKKAFK